MGATEYDSLYQQINRSTRKSQARPQSRDVAQQSAPPGGCGQDGLRRRGAVAGAVAARGPGARGLPGGAAGGGGDEARLLQSPGGHRCAHQQQRPSPVPATYRVPRPKVPGSLEEMKPACQNWQSVLPRSEPNAKTGFKCALSARKRCQCEACGTYHCWLFMPERSPKTNSLEWIQRSASGRRRSAKHAVGWRTVAHRCLGRGGRRGPWGRTGASLHWAEAASSLPGPATAAARQPPGRASASGGYHSE